MNSTVDIPPVQEMDAEAFDVIIIGAGLSGIGTAVRLQRDCPDRDFILLERREAIGGTWDLFRYPGIRSDSDMHTLGYDFKPWEAEKSIADGPSILSYVNETADEHRIRERIRFSQKLIAADWCSERSQWQLTVETPEGVRRYRCGFLLMCARATTATIRATSPNLRARRPSGGSGSIPSFGRTASITQIKKSW